MSSQSPSLPLHLKSLIPLSSDNFTSLRRTPWAGRQLAQGIKSQYAHSTNQKIGESWEISCDRDAPSFGLIYHDKEPLSSIIERHPKETLSPNLVDAGRDYCDLLVKLVNADTPLSLQIHPADDNPYLTTTECGKPESWLILDALPGAGLHLGFAKKLSVATIEALLRNGGFTADLLHFVPVRAGDFFEISPGVPHAIGPGVVVLEPQRVARGKSGKTWRLWDWNRLYDGEGNLDIANGKPRQLHIAESISLLKPESQIGDDYINTLRKRPEQHRPSLGSGISIYPANDYYQVLFVELNPDASVVMTNQCGFAGLTMIAGQIRATSLQHGTTTQHKKGESAFAPSSALPQKICNVGKESAKFSWIIPAGVGVGPHQGLVFEP